MSPDADFQVWIMRLALPFCVAVAMLQYNSASALDIYLYDLLNRSNYRAAYNRMLETSPSLPQWIKDYSRTLNGPSTPAKDVRIGGQTYALADACKVHSCPGNELYVLFDERGERAWGRLSADGRVQWLGNPSANVKRILEKASQ